MVGSGLSRLVQTYRPTSSGEARLGFAELGWAERCIRAFDMCMARSWHDQSESTEAECHLRHVSIRGEEWCAMK